MQRTILGRCCLLLLASMTLASAINAQTTKLPLADFLAVQGQTSIYLPPVPDYVGWGQALCMSGGLGCMTPPYTGYCTGTLASVDYAGIADKFIVSNGGQSSGTATDGSVIVRQLANSRVEVTVSLHTTNALTFVMAPFPLIPRTSCMSPSDVNFATQPLILGARANTVSPPLLANRALGESFFHITYQAAASTPLMDLIDLFNNHFSDIQEYSFHAVADGPTPEGGQGTVTVQQTGKNSRGNIEAAVVNFRPKGK